MCVHACVQYENCDWVLVAMDFVTNIDGRLSTYKTCMTCVNIKTIKELGTKPHH